MSLKHGPMLTAFMLSFLIETKLIIWDESPMMNSLCFEAFGVEI